MESCYRVVEPFVAVNIGDKAQFVPLPAGAVIHITGPVQRSGLVKIQYGGRILEAFVRDIEDRTHRFTEVSPDQR